MIALATPTFDLSGSLLLRHTDKSDLGSMPRRSSVVATIDGGGVPQYRGYSVTDRKFKIVAGAVPPAEVAQLRYLVANYNELLVATDEGLFLCAVLVLKIGANSITLNLNVVSQEA